MKKEALRAAVTVAATSIRFTRDALKMAYNLVTYSNRYLAKGLNFALNHAENKKIEGVGKVGKTVGHFMILSGFGIYCMTQTKYFDYPILFLVFGLTVHAFHVYGELDGDKPHGKARFSNYLDIIKKGLLSVPMRSAPKGIVFGRYGGKLVVKPTTEDGHVLVMGGTGDGKSKSFAIPTLLNWKGSIITIDIKGELYQTTANVRKKYGKVYRFDPTTACDQYNPIIECRTTKEAEDLAFSLIPIPNKDPFFARAAQGIFAAAVLEGYYTKKSLPWVAKRVNRTKLLKLAEELVSSPYPGVPDLASVALDIGENTAANVAAELRTHTKSLSADPNYLQSISRSDWTAESLEESSTIYLTIPEHAIEQYRPILNIILDQVINHMTRRPEGEEPAILVLIDELPRLGKINQLVSSLGTLRSRNVHLVQIIQSLANLDDIYGATKKRVILDNCSYQLILGATDPDSQAYLSKRAGQKTVKTQNVTKGDYHNQDRVSESEQGVPLIRPEEFGLLKKPVLFIRKMQPIRLDQAWYNSDPDILKIYRESEKLPDKEREYVVPAELLGENVVPLKRKSD